jgi:hypothetical protein
MQRATEQALSVPTFRTPADCTSAVLGGLWPAELHHVTAETASVAEHLDRDLRRIATSANEKLRAISEAGLPDHVRQAEENRVVNVARAFAVLRVESTVRHLRREPLGFSPEYLSLGSAEAPASEIRRPEERPRHPAEPRNGHVVAPLPEPDVEPISGPDPVLAEHPDEHEVLPAPPRMEPERRHRYREDPPVLVEEPDPVLDDEEEIRRAPVFHATPQTFVTEPERHHRYRDDAPVVVAEPDPVLDDVAAEPAPEPTPVPEPAPKPEPIPAAFFGQRVVSTPVQPKTDVFEQAQETDQQRLRRLLLYVAKQEPGLKWAVGQRADGTTVLVTDLAQGWIPSGIELPAGVTLLPPARRNGTAAALLGATTLSATYTPGDSFRDAAQYGPTTAAVSARETEPVDDLAWQLAEATHWRDGIPRMVHTMAKAGGAGTGVVEAELDVLRVHLDTNRYQMLARYPDIETAVLLNCLLLAATEAIAAGDQISANYHFAWFQALSAPPPSTWGLQA